MILYGSSGVGEPAYAGAIETGDAPVVELGLTYDPTPSPIRTELIPVWLLLVVGAAFVTNWAGMRIGGA